MIIELHKLCAKIIRYLVSIYIKKLYAKPVIFTRVYMQIYVQVNCSALRRAEECLIETNVTCPCFEALYPPYLRVNTRAH